MTKKTDEPIDAEVVKQPGEIEFDEPGTEVKAADNNSLQSVNQHDKLIELAFNQNVPIEKMTALFELKERFEASEAKKAYNIAMSEFRKNPPVVSKDKFNKQYESRYAGVPHLIATVAPFLGMHGLTHSFDQDTSANPISVTCILTHEKGHSESTTMLGPPDDSGKKNDLQKIKSTVTYLRGSTFESITGIVASDAGDDDGNSATQEIEYLSEEQLLELDGIIDENEIDKAAFLKMFQIDKLEEVEAQFFDSAKKALLKSLK